MTSSPRLLWILLACSGGCAGAAAPLPVRALSHEPSPAVTPEAASERPPATRPFPRIGAPGGSGAGSRSIVPTQSKNDAPTQSGNEAVGGLDAGSGKSGRRG